MPINGKFNASWVMILFAKNMRLVADQKMEKRPLIGIPMRIELETDRFYLSRHYSEAVEAFGRHAGPHQSHPKG